LKIDAVVFKVKDAVVSFILSGSALSILAQERASSGHPVNENKQTGHIS